MVPDTWVVPASIVSGPLGGAVIEQLGSSRSKALLLSVDSVPVLITNTLHILVKVAPAKFAGEQTTLHWLR